MLYAAFSMHGHQSLTLKSKVFFFRICLSFQWTSVNVIVGQKPVWQNYSPRNHETNRKSYLIEDSPDPFSLDLGAEELPPGLNVRLGRRALLFPHPPEVTHEVASIRLEVPLLVVFS